MKFWILWTVALIVVLLALSLVLDAALRRGLNETVTVTESELGSGDPSEVVVVFPGAFSGAQFQFEPLAVELQDVNATVLYVEHSGGIYSAQKVDNAVLVAVVDYLKLHPVKRMTIVGSSAGGGRGARLAVNLHKAGALDGVETIFIGIDAVGSGGDLAAAGKFGGQTIGRLLLGPIWNLVPVPPQAIPPSSTPPLPEWEQHAEEGLSRARSTPLASFADQVGTMRSTKVKPDSLAWMTQVIYIQSERGDDVVIGDKSVETWRAAAGNGAFVHVVVPSGHTDYEANPTEYADVIRAALN